MAFDYTNRIRYSEIDENGRLTINSLVNYFQDISTFQTEDLGVGIDFLKKEHAAWILSFWQIVIDELPKFGQTITASTWPYEFRQFYGLRNFTLRDQEGNLKAWANSVWVLFDTDKQRPVKPMPGMIERYQQEEKLPMEYAPRKIQVTEDGIAEAEFTVERHHLDTNHHVNNGQYIAMAVNYLPEGFPIHQVRVEYRMQARLGDVIVPVVNRSENQVMVQLCNPEGKAYAVVAFDA